MNDSEAVVLTGGIEVTATSELEAVYLAHREPVFRYLRAMTGDEDAAIDLTAVTFERAFAELRRGNSVGLGWLLRTARNAAIDADRRARTAALFRLRSRQAPPLVVSAEDEAIGAEQVRRLRAAMLELPAPQRDAIALRYSSDLSVREIADVSARARQLPRS
jgi:RNA polymerase sigma-70 factor (ECF subfamily)